MTLTAMEILERCRRAEGEKRRLKERADMIRDTAGHMTASLDGIGARSTGETDHMLTMVGMLDTVERELKQRDREYTAEVAAACQLMDMLPPMECSVLSRYSIRQTSFSKYGEAYKTILQRTRQEQLGGIAYV